MPAHAGIQSVTDDTEISRLCGNDNAADFDFN
jgi:hypothetical protein